MGLAEGPTFFHPAFRPFSHCQPCRACARMPLTPCAPCCLALAGLGASPSSSKPAGALEPVLPFFLWLFHVFMLGVSLMLGRLRTELL